MAALACHSAFAVSLPKTVEFNRDIRPILADNCFACHGPDKNKRKANLRLDTQEGLFAEIGGRHLVVPGKTKESELFRRITTHDADDLMPKSKTGARLSITQVELIKRWIEQGAKWEGHWAFNPLTRPAVPEVKKPAWIKNPIDNFILSRLAHEGLKPSPEADRRTLIRRVSFDLTGLPPTPEEARAFIADKNPDAYDRLVDRLMASPQYGERIAMYWLDEVRYADTDGFHADNYRSVFPYRDYVINAFNTNMAFDRFTIEQLAGDLLPDATVAQKIASTYNRLNRTTEEGGAQPKEYLAKYAADRVRATSEAWLGATMGCAECHDHKFDPYTTKDFYSFEAFFADIKEKGVGVPETSPAPNETQAGELKQIAGEINGLQKVLGTPTPELVAAQLEWEKTFEDQKVATLDDWHWIGPFPGTNYDHAFNEAFPPEKEIDFSKGYPGGTNSLAVDLAAPDDTGPGLAPDPELANKPAPAVLNWTTRTDWSDAVIHNDLAGEHAANYLYRTITVKAAGTLELSLGSHDGIRVWLNGKEVLNNPSKRVIAPGQQPLPLRLALGENKLLVKIVNDNGAPAFYFKAGSMVPESMPELIKIKPAERTETQKKELASAYRAVAPALETVRNQLAAAKTKRDGIYANCPKTLSVETVEPRVMRILPRGNWMRDDGEIVTPAVPRFLGGWDLGERRATRLDLAKWLVSGKNPLTARVFVNRFWKLFYGKGLSKTLEESGTRSEWPTHPELLDWLAMEFMESGWDVKHLVRLLVTANSYRQASEMTAKLREKDPANQLLARQSSFRLDAEMVRDNALAVSGLLVKKIGGPSVKPYQPAGYWDALNFPKRTYQDDQGESEYRRGLYTFWCRTYLNPSLLAFDASPREECTVERPQSSTPMQALTLLNDTTYVEAARVLGEHIVRHGGTNFDTRINWVFDHALERQPRKDELKLLKKLYDGQLEYYKADPGEARKLLSSGQTPAPKEVKVEDVAAWTAISRVILNLHESITRY